MVKMELFVAVPADGAGPRLLWRGGESGRPQVARIAELRTPGPIAGTEVDPGAIQPQIATAPHGSTAVAECAFEGGKGIVVHRLLELVPPPAAPPLPELLEVLVREREYDAALRLVSENVPEVERDPALWVLRVRAWAGARQWEEAAADAGRLLVAPLDVPLALADRAWSAVRDAPQPWPEQLSQAVVQWWEAHPGARASAFPRELVPASSWPRPVVLATLDELLKARSPDGIDEAPALLERLEALSGPNDAAVASRRQRLEEVRAGIEELASTAATWTSELWPEGKVRPLEPGELGQGWEQRELPRAAFKEPNLRDVQLPDDARELLLHGALPRKGRPVCPGIADWEFGPGKGRGPLGNLEAGTRTLHLADGAGWRGALYVIGGLKNAVGGSLCIDSGGVVYLELESTVIPLAGSLGSFATLLLARVAFGARMKQVYGKRVPKAANASFIEAARVIDPAACERGALVDRLLDLLPW